MSVDTLYNRNFSNCWICDKMIEAEFVWHCSPEGDSEPIYLHLSCDDYNYELLEDMGDGTFAITRVIPSTKVHFFFSHNGRVMLDSKYPTVELVEPFEKAVEFWPGYVANLYVDKMHSKTFHGGY
jgi:hypothetical protein